MTCLNGLLTSLLGVALSVSGCATTKVHSQLDPQSAQREYQKIMVHVDFADSGLQQDAEREFQSRAMGRRTQMVPFHRLFSSGREYSKEERTKVLADAGIEAVLFVVSTGSGSTAAYVPALGRVTEAPTAAFRAELSDLKTGRVVWMAVMESGPKGAMSTAYGSVGWKDIAKSLARRTVHQLVADGILR